MMATVARLVVNLCRPPKLRGYIKIVKDKEELPRKLLDTTNEGGAVVTVLFFAPADAIQRRII